MADKSKVYFTDLRVRLEDGLLKKLDRLIRAAGMETIDFKNKFAAIKIHFGEPGNMAYLRPQYAARMAGLGLIDHGHDVLADIVGDSFQFFNAFFHSFRFKHRTHENGTIYSPLFQDADVIRLFLILPPGTQSNTGIT